MSANGAAVNPLYATKIGVFNGKEKNMHNVLKRTNMYFGKKSGGGGYELCGHVHIK